MYKSPGMVIAAVIGLFLGSQAALAIEPEVRDDAHFFKPETVTKANEQIREIKQKFKKDLLIETFPSVPEGKEEEATSKDLDVKKRFFATWARQRARDARITGIYVLITRKPGHIQVEVGNNTEKVFPRTDRDRLAKMLIDYFKKEDYDKGLLEGIRFVRSILQENKGALSHAAVHEDDFGPTQVAKESPAPSLIPKKAEFFSGLGGVLCIGLVVVVVPGWSSR